MLGIFEFGSRLLETNDLDPVYVTLWKSKLELPLPQLKRLILAYSCFYHLGVAAKISEKSGKKYWDMLYEAAVNEGLKWPRGAERRHFRGKAAIMAVGEIRTKNKTPEKLIEYWAGEDLAETTFSIVSKRVQESTLFGPWISFKIADMLERQGWPVNFSNCELGIYKDPRQGAALYRHRDANYPITNEELKNVIEELIYEFSRFNAPPMYERAVNVQEVESILCKWKSHRKGHYEIGKDIREIRHALAGWGNTAKLLLRNMPREV